MMKAVILAAGRGTRMGDLTEEIPKPMLSIQGKPLLAYKLDALPPEVEGVILVVGYRHSVIEQFFGDSYEGRTVEYAVQESLNGTAAAVHTARNLLTGSFLVLMGDDLYDPSSLRELITHERSMLAFRVTEPRHGAKVNVDSNGNLAKIDEHGELEKGDLINTAAYVLDLGYFDLPMKKLPNGEFGLPQTLANSITHYSVQVVETDRWIQVSSPDDLKKAAAWL